MRIPSFRTAAIVLAAGIGLGGCATYSPYGYGGGVSVSLGTGYGGYGRYGGYGGFYDPFYDPYYRGYRSYYGSRFGGYYGSPYGGWYSGFYYPGFGRYVYDRHNRRQVWNDGLRNYWSTRRARLESSGVTNPAVTTGSSGTIIVRERPGRTRVNRIERNRPAVVERNQTIRTERRSAVSERRAERAAARSARERVGDRRRERDD